MPKLKNRPPRLCKDKTYAVVYCNGTRLPMGKWKTPEAEKNYRRFLAEWTACVGTAAIRPGKKVIIDDVLAGYLEWAEKNLDRRNYRHARAVATTVQKLYAGLPVDEFGGKCLMAVQEELEKTGRCSRNYINSLICRFRTMLRWGVARDLVSNNTVKTIECVQPLRKGRTTAHETKRRKNVPDEVVEATLPHLSPTIATMVQVQSWSLMRPCEVCRMKVGEIDKSRTDGIWLYQPPEHKGAWREQDKEGEYARKIPLGKPEQELLAAFMVSRSPEQTVFSDGNGNPYYTDKYTRNVTKSIRKANLTLPDDQKIPAWTPYQLRHAGITKLIAENEGNKDIARVVAGQKTIEVTEMYNHADVIVAIEQAKKRGEKSSKKPE
jgi:integrase